MSNQVTYRIKQDF